MQAVAEDSFADTEASQRSEDDREDDEEEVAELSLEELRDRVRKREEVQSKLSKHKNLRTSLFQGEKVSFHKQGDLFMYTDEAKKKREAALKSPELRDCLLEWWTEEFNQSEGGTMPKKTFVQVCCIIAKALIPDMSALQARKTAEDDWQNDYGSKTGLNFPAFTKSMSELIDLWTQGTDVEEYVKFTKKMREKVRKKLNKTLLPPKIVPIERKPRLEVVIDQLVKKKSFGGRKAASQTWGRPPALRRQVSMPPVRDHTRVPAAPLPEDPDRERLEWARKIALKFGKQWREIAAQRAQARRDEEALLNPPKVAAPPRFKTSHISVKRASSGLQPDNIVVREDPRFAVLARVTAASPEDTEPAYYQQLKQASMKRPEKSRPSMNRKRQSGKAENLYDSGGGEKRRQGVARASKGGRQQQPRQDRESYVSDPYSSSNPQQYKGGPGWQPPGTSYDMVRDTGSVRMDWGEHPLIRQSREQPFGRPSLTRSSLQAYRESERERAAASSTSAVLLRTRDGSPVPVPQSPGPAGSPAARVLAMCSSSPPAARPARPQGLASTDRLIPSSKFLARSLADSGLEESAEERGPGSTSASQLQDRLKTPPHLNTALPTPPSTIARTSPTHPPSESELGSVSASEIAVELDPSTHEVLRPPQASTPPVLPQLPSPALAPGTEPSGSGRGPLPSVPSPRVTASAPSPRTLLSAASSDALPRLGNQALEAGSLPETPFGSRPVTSALGGPGQGSIQEERPCMRPVPPEPAGVPPGRAARNKSLFNRWVVNQRLTTVDQSMLDQDMRAHDRRGAAKGAAEAGHPVPSMVLGPWSSPAYAHPLPPSCAMATIPLPPSIPNSLPVTPAVGQKLRGLHGAALPPEWSAAASGSDSARSDPEQTLALSPRPGQTAALVQVRGAMFGAVTFVEAEAPELPLQASSTLAPEQSKSPPRLHKSPQRKPSRGGESSSRFRWQYKDAGVGATMSHINPTPHRQPRLLCSWIH